MGGKNLYWINTVYNWDRLVAGNAAYRNAAYFNAVYCERSLLKVRLIRPSKNYLLKLVKLSTNYINIE